VCCLTNKIVVAFLLGAGLGGAAWGTYEWAKPNSIPTLPIVEAPAQDEPAPTPAPKAKAKSEHPPAAALRDRVLAEFHGAAANTFTAIPGFGMERMVPLYKKIPFEVPYFSTGDLEAAEGPKKVPAMMTLALAKTHAQFEKLTPAPVTKEKDSRFGYSFEREGWGTAFHGTVAYGVQLRMLDLVGLTDREAPKVFVGGQPFELIRLGNEETKDLTEGLKKISGKDANLFGFYGKGITPEAAKELHILKEGTYNVVESAQPKPVAGTRPLDMFEVAGAKELMEGKDVYIRSKDNVVRMLGALRATEQCLKCHHETKSGDLLGAFSYVFVDANGELKKGMK